MNSPINRLIMFRYLYISLLLLLLTNSCSFQNSGQQNFQNKSEVTNSIAAKKIQLEGVGNLYQVSEELYRSEQPNKKGFANLKKMGIQSVLNLRKYHTDNDEAAGLNLNLYTYKMSAGNITEEDIDKCIRIIRMAPKPILIHCMHGSDRTGTIVAAYRIMEQNWSVDDAIAELQEKQYGYHKYTYPYIPKLLKNIDWEKLKSNQ